jgi:hypothetical protein
MWPNEGGGAMADLDTRLNAAKEHYDTLLKGSFLLGSLNGVGVVTSFALFKDYISLPPLLSPGLFLFVFGVGLLGSIVFYASLALSKVELLQALVSQEPDFTRGLPTAAAVGVVIGIGALVVALGIAIYKFAFL